MNEAPKTTTSRPDRNPLVYWLIAAGVVLAIALIVYDGQRSAKVVVARVNGEPIYAVDLNLPNTGDSFDEVADKTRQKKIQRVAEQLAYRQYLTKHNVSVSEDEVDYQVKALESNLPTTGCPCCTFPDVGKYLASIGYSMGDLRKELKNDVGLQKCLSQSWESSPAELRKRQAERADYVRRHYVHGWQIFFNTFQKVGDKAQIRQRESARAQDAWSQLQHGKAFAAVATAMSEDMTSNRKGGSLGFIDRASYGREFERTLISLKPGQCSPPFESPWGFHIVEWEPMTETDVAQFCQTDFQKRELERMRGQIVHDAKIEITRANQGS